uniref:BPTI/Kunitz inhibitor domain-containing protein n=1 Tax=Ditylenchus dipsaci TaxID=166011 RepID=A0A915DWZ9_9BILA
MNLFQFSTINRPSSAFQPFSTGNQINSFVFPPSQPKTLSRPVRQQALTLGYPTASDVDSQHVPVSYYVEEINKNGQKEPASHTSTAFFNTNEVAAESQALLIDKNLLILTKNLQNTHSSPIHQSQLCALPEERGSCYGNQLRWRYDSEALKCTSFLYSGCDSNANHFTSTEACERACGMYRQQKVCHLGHDSGSCTTLPLPLLHSL